MISEAKSEALGPAATRATDSDQVLLQRSGRSWSCCHNYAPLSLSLSSRIGCFMCEILSLERTSFVVERRASERATANQASKICQQWRDPHLSHPQRPVEVHEMSAGNRTSLSNLCARNGHNVSTDTPRAWGMFCSPHQGTPYLVPSTCQNLRDHGPGWCVSTARHDRPIPPRATCAP